ncbi:translocation/assembly module TamB domain-containing protein [Chitinophaga deserti]|uniref:translocation/assembly module TamB domain-containing protein n=1 Tax=Chitinophaga deserti TaxID=2164099 RepID=UPI000D6CA488|nr:translocation/assembly module TamB domain-containing protein [Chitinophaga deserti]
MTIALLSLLGLLLLVSILVNIPAVQNFLVKEVTARLSKQLNTRVEIRHVNFRLFNSMRLEGTLVEDRNKDTLLYAEALHIRITDWFFIQEKPVLKFIGLEDAQVNLIRPRNDSAWNYQFIIDEFGGAPVQPAQKQRTGISLDLKKVDFRRVRFNITDKWVGEDMNVAADRIYLDAEQLDLLTRDIRINELLLDKPMFIVSSYPSSPLRKKRPPSPAAPKVVLDTLSPVPLRWNADNWKLVVRSLQIKDGDLGINNLSDTIPSTPGEFDPSRIRFSGINLAITNSRLVKDSIIADLTLRTRERSGFEVKSLKSRFKMSPVEMEFTNLDLVTNNSHIKDYYTMQYEDMADLGDYVDLVTMKANFRGTRLSSDDIAFFAPPLSAWDTEILVNGSVEGPVSNLSADSMDLKGGRNTRLRGNFSMRGLPYINETFIDFNAKELITSGTDVRQFFPLLKDITAVRTDLITHLAFQGSFTGFVNDFVAYGKFQTNLGNLDSDINFKTSKDVPVYSGSITTYDFQLGNLLDNNIVDRVTMKAKVKGEGFNFRNLKAAVDADIQQIGLYGYEYRNLKTEGEMNRKFFNGSLTVNDPNLDMDFTGTIDFNSRLPIFNFYSEIRNSDLKALHLTEDSITLQAKADLNFSGSNIDNFDGTARLYDLSLFKNKSRVEFDSLSVYTGTENGQKTLRILGNEVNGFVQGSYSFMELPNAFKLFLNKYYPSYFKSPPMINTGQDFRFAFEFGEVDKLISAFSDDIRGFDGTRIEGALNSLSGSVSLNATVPYAAYTDFGVRNLVLKSTGDFGRINVSTSLGEVLFNDSTIFRNPLILASSGKDTSLIKLDLQAEDTTSLNGFYARLVTVGDGVKVNFLNSTFTVNGKPWNMTPGNEVYWSTHFLTVHNLNITRNDQRITISTNEYNPDESRFMINLKDLNLADILPSGITQTLVEGLANGEIDVHDPFGKLTVDANIRTSQLRIDNDSIGLVNWIGNYNNTQGQLTFDVKADNSLASFIAKGTIGLSDSNRVVSASTDLNNTSISLLNKYLGDYVSDLTGTATGHLEVTGTTDKPSFRGSVKVQNIGMKVNYLGTYYKIPLLHVHHMDDNLIEMKPFTLIDKFNNTAVVNGFIQHQNFYDMNFEFDVQSGKFLFLDTGPADNELYYGTVLSQGRVYFTGPLDNLELRVLARPLKGTHFYLPLSDSKDIGKHEYIKFRQYGKVVEEPKKKSDIKLNVKMDIAANPDAQIDVILNASTNDVISANGTGNLAINVNLEGDFTMYGNYTINSGTYNFSFQRLASWKFDIDKNSTITWNGDPGEAIVNITAKYTLPKVSLYNLSTAAQLGSGANVSASGDKLNRAERVDILLYLRQSLTQPNITYEITLPDVGSLAYESGIGSRLKEINSNQNQALYQISYLLATGQFQPPDGSANVAITGKNSVGQALSAQASAILNNFSNTFLKNAGIGFNVNYTAYNFNNSESSSFDRNLVSTGITKSFLNNRIRLYVGGNYDWGRVSASSSTQNFAGDFRIEYLLTPDGRVRLNAFSKMDYDVLLLDNRMRSGIGMGYVRDFNRFSELFQDRQLRRIQDSLNRAAMQRRLQEDSIRHEGHEGEKDTIIQPRK